MAAVRETTKCWVVLDPKDGEKIGEGDLVRCHGLRWAAQRLENLGKIPPEPVLHDWAGRYPALWLIEREARADARQRAKMFRALRRHRASVAKRTLP